MNNLQIIGNLTADPKEYSTKDGILCAKFTVAVNGYGESVEYISVTAWRKPAENCLRYLKKAAKSLSAARQLVVYGKAKAEKPKATSRSMPGR